MGTKRGLELDDGLRSSVVALNKKARMPLSEITNLTGIPKSTVARVIDHAVTNARENVNQELLRLGGDIVE